MTISEASRDEYEQTLHTLGGHKMPNPTTLASISAYNNTTVIIQQHGILVQMDKRIK